MDIAQPEVFDLFLSSDVWSVCQSGSGACRSATATMHVTWCLVTSACMVLHGACLVRFSFLVYYSRRLCPVPFFLSEMAIAKRSRRDRPLWTIAAQLD